VRWLRLVEKHRHCIVCGLPISPEKQPPVCSKKCEFLLKRRERRERIFWSLFMVPLIVLMVLLLILGRT